MSLEDIIDNAQYRGFNLALSKVNNMKEPYLRKILNGIPLPPEDRIKLETIEEITEELTKIKETFIEDDE